MKFGATMVRWFKQIKSSSECYVASNCSRENSCNFRSLLRTNQLKNVLIIDKMGPDASFRPKTGNESRSHITFTIFHKCSVQLKLCIDVTRNGITMSKKTVGINIQF